MQFTYPVATQPQKTARQWHSSGGISKSHHRRSMEGRDRLFRRGCCRGPLRRRRCTLARDTEACQRAQSGTHAGARLPDTRRAPRCDCDRTPVAILRDIRPPAAAVGQRGRIEAHHTVGLNQTNHFSLFASPSTFNPRVGRFCHHTQCSAWQILPVDFVQTTMPSSLVRFGCARATNSRRVRRCVVNGVAGSRERGAK